MLDTVFVNRVNFKNSFHLFKDKLKATANPFLMINTRFDFFLTK